MQGKHIRKADPAERQQPTTAQANRRHLPTCGAGIASGVRPEASLAAESVRVEAVMNRAPCSASRRSDSLPPASRAVTSVRSMTNSLLFSVGDAVFQASSTSPASTPDSPPIKRKVSECA
jgi:hypothetical protein